MWNSVAADCRRGRGVGGALLWAWVTLLLFSGGCVARDDGPQRNTFVPPEPVEVGRLAPDFALPDHNNETVRLGESRGQWVVLYFYPADDVCKCWSEQTEFTRVFERFAKMKAMVLCISSEAPLKHRFFRKTYDLDVTLLSDEDRSVMRRYGVWRQMQWRGRTVGRAIRTTFLIDPAGRIAWRWDHVTPGDHVEQVKLKLNGLVDREVASAAAGR